MEFFASAVLLVLVSSSALAAEDNLKNHRLEKRQDTSYFFGGWRPLHPAASSSYFHTSGTGRYHNLMSVLPGSLDAASRYYTHHALPSATNYKDIFSYYPRPAIKTRPRKNTPVYMERLKPKRQQPSHGSRGRGGGRAPQILDIQNIDLKQIQGLQDLLLHAKELQLPQKGANPYEMLQLSLQTLPQSGYSVGSTRSVSRYNQRSKRPQGGKGGYGSAVVPQSYAPAQFQYLEMPNMKNLLPQIFSKDVSIAPVQIPHQIRSLEDIMGLKNVQVIEVPVPVSSGNKGGQGYGSRVNAYSQPQYQAPKTATKVSFPMNTYYTHQSQQPRQQQYTSQTASGYSQQQQQMPQIEAELVKLSEEEIQALLGKLQLVQKNSQDFLKVLPLSQATPHKSNNGQVQLIFSLPEDQVQGQQRDKSSGGYGSAQAYEVSQEDSYKGGEQQQYVAIPQEDPYQGNNGGYQLENQAVNQHNAAGYQIEEQQDGRGSYGQKYQPAQDMTGYRQAASYEQDTKSKGYSGEGQQEYKQSGYGSTAARQPGQYLEIISPPSENGYRREPVLAVEIQKGQSIEDVIKAIDPKTLQQLGAHGKEGLEIEVVEVPVEEYSAESKKAVTYVSSANVTTTEAPVRRSSVAATATTTSSQDKSTTATRKSNSSSVLSTGKSKS